MKRILVLGCGGPAAINFTRSLKSAPEKFYIVGTDINKYKIHLAETDRKYLMPPISSQETLSLLWDIIKKEKIDFIHAQPDVCVSFLSKFRDEIDAKVFLPGHDIIEICQDKFKSYERWQAAGIKVPRTIEIRSEQDLEKALREWGEIWLRKRKGAFGKASIPISVENFSNLEEAVNFAKIWMHYWGQEGFIASERLNEAKMITWSAIFNNGELVVAQTRERLYWEFSNRTISGVTGLTGCARTKSDPEFDEIALKAILAIDKNPHGIYSVDCTYDFEGVPNPTEINIGRFFTTIDFFTKLGLNMPYIYIKTAFKESVAEYANDVWINYPKKINPLPEKFYWIRGIDSIPRLVAESHIQKYVHDLEKRKLCLKSS